MPALDIFGAAALCDGDHFVQYEGLGEVVAPDHRHRSTAPATRGCEPSLCDQDLSRPLGVAPRDVQLGDQWLQNLQCALVRLDRSHSLGDQILEQKRPDDGGQRDGVGDLVPRLNPLIDLLDELP